MKRVGNLHEQIAEPENLRLANFYLGHLDHWSWSEAELARHMEALLSYVRFADTLELRRDLVRRFSRAA